MNPLPTDNKDDFEASAEFVTFDVGNGTGVGNLIFSDESIAKLVQGIFATQNPYSDPTLTPTPRAVPTQ